MIIKKVIIGLGLLLMLTSCSINARIQKADKKFELGEYYTAGEMYRSIYPRIPAKKNKKQKAEVAFKMGNSYRLIANNKRAEAAYKNAVRYNYKDSMVHYYYAEVLKSSGKYKEALKQYQEFEKLSPENELALAGIASCDSALNAWKKKSRYEVELFKKFNSKFSDFCPIFASKDGSLVYFNSTRGGKKVKNSKITGQKNNDIFYSRINAKGEWENPELLEGEINTEFDEGVCALSADGQELFYTVSVTSKGETLGTAIYSSKRSGGEWSEPQKLKILQDSSLNVAHPAPSIDGEYLYFVSDMPGGFGGKDIWRVSKNGAEWGTPENLGASINTPADEMFPSFREDGRLYFSSDGRVGLGGLDIYEATLLPKEKESDPDTWNVVHLPAPLNSSADDFGITFLGKENRGFFSSNRNNKKFYDHIWSFYEPELEFSISGTAIDNKGEALGDAVIKVVGDNGIITSAKTKKNGSYKINLPKNANYVILGTCRGYLNNKSELEIPNLEDSKDFKIDFTLNSISKPVKMNNIFYEFGSAKLTPESTAGLNDLVKLLNDNPNITIEIGAHTDHIGTEEANMKLSHERAMSVVNYLTEHGIEPARITAKGYGESTPVVPDRDLVAKNRFLRVNVPLTEEFITKLNSEQQEIAKQINRRTEFKVLKTTYNMY
jgi:peptidoglycan-associated lipoprotein